jgi:hypothetical protein
MDDVVPRLLSGSRERQHRQPMTDEWVTGAENAHVRLYRPLMEGT